MIAAPISLQDLRRRIYVAAKPTSAGRGGVRRGSMNGSGSSEITEFAIGARPKALPVDRSHNPYDAKQTGERRTGNPFAPFDEAGAGDGLTRAPRQSSTLPVGHADETSRAQRSIDLAVAFHFAGRASGSSTGARGYHAGSGAT